MASTDVERRITELEDIEAIKELKALYCDICDDDHNPDRIWRSSPRTASGKAAISARLKAMRRSASYLRVFKKPISFSQHNVFNPQSR